mmetsp:Transcript_85567/g.228926  ORF Transcript_85567/g.228926 Transcript_85567/m.228926 type:complete len:251 (-) Transcript_85567:331-1083(-)
MVSHVHHVARAGKPGVPLSPCNMNRLSVAQAGAEEHGHAMVRCGSKQHLLLRRAVAQDPPAQIRVREVHLQAPQGLRGFEGLVFTHDFDRHQLFQARGPHGRFHPLLHPMNPDRTLRGPGGPHALEIVAKHAQLRGVGREGALQQVEEGGRPADGRQGPDPHQAPVFEGTQKHVRQQAGTQDPRQNHRPLRVPELEAADVLLRRWRCRPIHVPRVGEGVIVFRRHPMCAGLAVRAPLPGPGLPVPGGPQI